MNGLARFVNRSPDRRPWWAYTMRPVIHVWVYLLVRAHRRTEPERQQAAAAARVAKQQIRDIQRQQKRAAARLEKAQSKEQRRRLR